MKRVNGNGTLAGNEESDTLEATKVGHLPAEPMQCADQSYIKPKIETSTAMVNCPLNLQELLLSYLKAEFLNGQNQYRCDNCVSLQDAEQRHYFTLCPKYLIMTLKRFTYDIKTQRRGKILQNVKFPSDITVPVLANEIRKEASLHNECYRVGEGYDVSEDNLARKESLCAIMDCTEDQSTHNNPRKVLQVVSEKCKSYTLVAVIVHAGVSPESGHYYCYCRHSPSREGENHFKSKANHSHSSLNDHSRNMDNQQTLCIDCSAVMSQPVENALDIDVSDIEGENTPEEWYLFNDNVVCRVDKSELERIQTDHPRDTPYVFIYEESCCISPNCDTEVIREELVSQVEVDNREYRMVCIHST